MCSLAAAISPGYFGFTNWAFAAEAPSEIAAQVPIATRKNNALIIIFLSHSFLLAEAPNLFGLFSRLGPDQSHRNQQRPYPLFHRRFRACAAVRSLLSAIAYDGRAVHGPREDAMRQVGRQAAGEPTGLCLSMTLRSPPARLARRNAKRVHRLF